jgi:hypothetical protein
LDSLQSIIDRLKTLGVDQKWQFRVAGKLAKNDDTKLILTLFITGVPPNLKSKPYEVTNISLYKHRRRLQFVVLFHLVLNCPSLIIESKVRTNNLKGKCANFNVANKQTSKIFSGFSEVAVGTIDAPAKGGESFPAQLQVLRSSQCLG